jgi:hypothetical protein
MDDSMKKDASKDTSIEAEIPETSFRSSGWVGSWTFPVGDTALIRCPQIFTPRAPKSLLVDCGNPDLILVDVRIDDWRLPCLPALTSDACLPLPWGHWMPVDRDLAMRGSCVVLEVASRKAQGTSRFRGVLWAMNGRGAICHEILGSPEVPEGFRSGRKSGGIVDPME